MSDDVPSPPPSSAPHQLHDKYFKTTFSDPETAAAFLRTQVPPAVAGHLDWSQLQVEEATFIDDLFKGSACDLLYRVPGRSAEGEERDVWLYVLFEHQREEDPWLALRLLGYMTRIWQRVRGQHPTARKLPPILPVVLAQNERPWQVSPRFLDLIEAPAGWDEEAWSLIPSFAYRLIQLAEMEPESIPGTPSGVLALRALRAERLGDLLSSAVWDELLMSRVSHVVVERHLLYIHFGGNFDKASFLRRLEQVTTPHLRATAMTYGEQLLQEGRQEGLQKGQVLASHRHILEVLEIRFERVPEGLREEIEAITDLERLSCLHRTAASCGDLEAFSREL